MNTRIITMEDITEFEKYLKEEEKSVATVEKYLRDVRTFFDFIKGNQVNKETVLNYKKSLSEKDYAVSSINSMLASLNSLLRFLGWEDRRHGSLYPCRCGHNLAGRKWQCLRSSFCCGWCKHWCAYN